MLNVALAGQFAQAGFLVFPLFKATGNRAWIEPKGWNKFPEGLADPKEKGDNPATSDQKVIQSWANIPQIIGYGICAPKHIVFDLDIKNGKNGIDEFKRLQLQHSIPNPKLIVKTKSGGLHLFYRREEVYQSAKISKATNLRVLNGDGTDHEYPGIDLIANSGYVVGPWGAGAWVEGEYSVVKGQPSDLSACPLEVVRKQIRGGSPAKATLGDELVNESAEDDLLDQIRAARIPKVVPVGRRDSLLTSLIGVLKVRRLPLETAKTLCEEFIRHCELSEGETRESLAESLGLESKLTRLYNKSENEGDPRVVARGLVDVAKVYLVVNQFNSGVGLVATEENPYMLKGSVMNEFKARQLLKPYERLIPESESKRLVNPIDLLLRDVSLPRVSLVGYYPKDIKVFREEADGSERVNSYIPPRIEQVNISHPTGIVDSLIDLSKVLCADLSDYMLDFMAHVVQWPEIKMNVAMLLISEVHGSGKNTLIQCLKPIIGPTNYASVSGIEPLIEDKSIILEGNVLVVFNEVHRPNNKTQRSDMSKAVNKIKTSVTEKFTQINPKFEKQRKISTFSNFVMLSNDTCPFDLEANDRRTVVINANPPSMDQIRFGKLADYANNDKNYRLTAKEFEYMTCELNDFFRSRIVKSDLRTGDSPMSEAKQALIRQGIPIAYGKLLDFIQADGLIEPFISEDLLVYIARNILGYKSFGVGQYEDVMTSAIAYKLVVRVYQSDGIRARVIDKLPMLINREDYPLLGKVNAYNDRKKVYCTNKRVIDQNLNISNGAIRGAIWKNVESFMSGTSNVKDIMSLIK